MQSQYFGNLQEVEATTRFKRQQTEGADVTRAEGMGPTTLIDRDARCVTRAWDRRKEKAAKQFTDRRFHLRRRVRGLKARVQTNAAHIFRLPKAVFGNMSELLHIADEGVASGSSGGGAEAGRHPVGEGALPPEASPSQRKRLLSQAMAILEVFERQRDRDLLMLGEIKTPSEPPTLRKLPLARSPAGSR